MTDKPKRVIKKVETVRERAQKASSDAPKRQRRIRVKAGAIRGATVFKPFGRIGRIIVPGFVRNTFKELGMVTWPDRKETWKLTSAVFVFAIAFGIVIAVVDYGLDKLFRSIILK
ncbi:MAG TPA: preprotein translocase subunit SecE [Candidatus Saccharimonadales bacterium]|nr:preprotein translocase subunit SecE [Candidatus Saccharimonadales bacterium]